MTVLIVKILTMAKFRLIPEGMSWDDLRTGHGFIRPTTLSGIITDVNFWDAQTGTGSYCKIIVAKKDTFIVRAEDAIRAGLPENAMPNQYFLEAGVAFKIRRL